MAIDVPCEMGCGRWASPLTARCETCNANKSVHKSHKPAQRMRYRQRLALAIRRQETYAEEFGDPKKVEEFEMQEPKGKGTGRRKADVIHLSTRRSKRKRA